MKISHKDKQKASFSGGKMFQLSKAAKRPPSQPAGSAPAAAKPSAAAGSGTSGARPAPAFNPRKGSSGGKKDAGKAGNRFMALAFLDEEQERKGNITLGPSILAGGGKGAEAAAGAAAAADSSTSTSTAVLGGLATWSFSAGGAFGSGLDLSEVAEEIAAEAAKPSMRLAMGGSGGAGAGGGAGSGGSSFAWDFSSLKESTAAAKDSLMKEIEEEGKKQEQGEKALTDSEKLAKLYAEEKAALQEQMSAADLRHRQRVRRLQEKSKGEAFADRMHSKLDKLKAKNKARNKAKHA